MAKTVHLAIIGVALLVGVAFIGASAFTTATLERDANIDVVADPSGIIALQDGTSGGLVQQEANGEIAIDFENAGAGLGANVQSRYELGDPANPTTEYAFNITNQDTVSHQIELEYTVADGTGVGDGVNATEFQAYVGGTPVDAIESEEAGTATYSLNSGQTSEVVVIVDTRKGNLQSTGNLSGTLNITAT